MVNERQLIRHYKREHYTEEVCRALRQFKNWIKDGSINSAFTKVKQSYGDMVYYQVIYHLNKKINEHY